MQQPPDMLVQLGNRTVPQDAVELLSGCHDRIRRFLILARRLATTSSVAEAEIRVVASQIRRYFASAFPLHVADEEETIEPRLAGHHVDNALDQMRADHVEHAQLVRPLVALCEKLERDPGQLPALATQLADVATRLALVLEAHLALEERIIFPALRRLSQGERDAIRDAMRARREIAQTLRR
jgi:iron-sulfur cluster repair protein YtfE (RIC family)